MKASDIIVQSTHGHAAPTLEGIWGPSPVPYLKLVHDLQLGLAVEALVARRTLVQLHYLTALPGLRQVLEVSRVLTACPGLGVWTLAGEEQEPQQVLAALQQVQASHLSRLPRPR